MLNVNYDYSLFLRKLILIRFNINNFDLKYNMHFNMNSKDIIINKKNLPYLLLSLKLMSALQSLPTFAKISVSTFKLRKNMAIGSKLYLNYKNALFFFYKLKNIILPTVDDLNAWSMKSLDIYYNYNMGLQDITVFPEINYSYNYFDKTLGMNINISKENINNMNTLNKCIINGMELPFLIK